MNSPQPTRSDGKTFSKLSLNEMFEEFRPRLRTLIELRIDRRIRARIDPSDVILQTLSENFDYDLAFQLEFGISLRQQADFLYVNDGQDPEVTLALERSEAVLSKIVENDNSDNVRVMALGNTCQAHAEILRLRHRPLDALVKSDRAISTFNLILDKDPTNVHARDSQFLLP